MTPEPAVGGPPTTTSTATTASTASTASTATRATPAPGVVVDAGLIVRPRSAPDLEIRVVPDELSIVRDDPPARPPADPSPPPADARPPHPARPGRLALGGGLVLSLLLTGAVDAPGNPAGPVRTRTEALAARTVQPAATLLLAGRPTATPVRLIGASDQGVAILQGAPAGSGAFPTIYTGSLAGRDGTMRLTARPGAGMRTRNGSLIRLSVAGGVLSWYELGGENNVTAYPEERRLDLATGQNATSGRSGSLTVREQGQGGGATAPYTQIDPGGKIAPAASGPWLKFASVSARIVQEQGRWVLEHAPVGTRAIVRVALPKGVTGDSGLDAVGDLLYTASSGRHPAVYVIQGRSVTKVADLPVARYPVLSWSLAGGALQYTDRSGPAARAARQSEGHPAFLDHQPDPPLHAPLHLDAFVSGRHGGSSAPCLPWGW